MKQILEEIIRNSTDRSKLWENIINHFDCKDIVEVGVYKGEFAERILGNCPQIEKYAMVDPWRNLADWNKPANKDNSTFEAFYQETLSRTDFAKEKREILRGKTTEVLTDVANDSYDFAYIDGDHTLKGITIDLVTVWDKVKTGGFITGDDFSSTIWQHNRNFEPTMVFPFAIYFAEAKGAKIFGLPHSQFIMTKSTDGFEFVDFTNGTYKNTELRDQLLRGGGNNNSLLRKVYRKIFK